MGVLDEWTGGSGSATAAGPGSPATVKPKGSEEFMVRARPLDPARIDYPSALTDLALAHPNFERALECATRKQIEDALATMVRKDGKPKKGAGIRINRIYEEMVRRGWIEGEEEDPAPEKVQVANPKDAPMTFRRGLRDQADPQTYDNAWRMSDTYERLMSDVLGALTRLERYMEVVGSLGAAPEEWVQHNGGWVDNVRSAMKKMGDFETVFDLFLVNLKNSK